MKKIINLTMKDFSRTKLKRCPFCDSKDIHLRNTHTPYYWIECDNCSAQIHSDLSDFKESLAGHKSSALHVITKWNNRY